MADQDLSPGEALAELIGLMRQTAVSGGSQRPNATRYTAFRDILMQSFLRPYLPGFVHQCLTIARFQDFIHLLDPREEVRLLYLERAFEASLRRSAGDAAYMLRDGDDF